MHGLAGHPEPGRDIGDRHPVVEDLENCLIALLHDTELHQNRRHASLGNSTENRSPSNNRASGTDVGQAPEPPRPSTARPCVSGATTTCLRR